MNYSENTVVIIIISCLIIFYLYKIINKWFIDLRGAFAKLKLAPG